MGFGGSVDIAVTTWWNVPGRHGWVGGTGTSAHITPSAGTAAILAHPGRGRQPVPPEWTRDFWRGRETRYRWRPGCVVI